jgi:hypothetical protein
LPHVAVLDRVSQRFGAEERAAVGIDDRRDDILLGGEIAVELAAMPVAWKPFSMNSLRAASITRNRRISALFRCAPQQIFESIIPSSSASLDACS